MRHTYSLCAATLKRADDLRELLERLVVQKNPGNWDDWELIIADNDSDQSARPVFDHYNAIIPFECRYETVPERGLVHVRNRLLSAARNANVVFLDDDQLVHPDFCVSVAREWGLVPQSVVAGQFQLICHFDDAVPPQVIHVAKMSLETNFAERFTPRTSLATCGCVIRKEVLTKNSLTFDLAFNLTGGEDIHLAERLRAIGTIVGLNDVVVYEKISLSRSHVSWWLRSSLRKGAVFVMARFRGGNFFKGIPHLVLAAPLAIWFLLAGICMFSRQDGRRYFLFCRAFRQLGKIAGFFGYFPEMYLNGRV